MHHHYSSLIHPGHSETYLFCKKQYYIYKLAELINIVLKNCGNCIRSKSKPKANPFIKTITSHFNEIIIFDIKGPYPQDNDGYRFLFTIIDRFSRYLIICPMKTINLFTLIWTLLNCWIFVYGPPKTLQSDRAPSHLSEIMNHLLNQYQIHHIHSSPYYPQANGMVEQVHHYIDTSFKILANTLNTTFFHLNWSKYIKLIQSSWNFRVKRATKFQPNELVFGQNTPNFDISNVDASEKLIKNRNYKEYFRTLGDKQIQKFYAAMENQLHNATLYGKNITKLQTFNKGDTVIVYDKFKRIGNKRKLLNNYENATYTVLQKLNPNVYKVQNNENQQIKVLNKLYLKQYNLPKSLAEVETPLSNFKYLNTPETFDAIPNELDTNEYSGINIFDNEYTYGDENEYNEIPPYSISQHLQMENDEMLYETDDDDENDLIPNAFQPSLNIYNEPALPYPNAPDALPYPQQSSRMIKVAAPNNIQKYSQKRIFSKNETYVHPFLETQRAALSLPSLPKALATVPELSEPPPSLIVQSLNKANIHDTIEHHAFKQNKFEPVTTNQHVFHDYDSPVESIF